LVVFHQSFILYGLDSFAQATLAHLNPFARRGRPAIARAPLWVLQLWQSIAAALRELPIELESNSAMGVEGMRKVGPLFIKP